MCNLVLSFQWFSLFWQIIRTIGSLLVFATHSLLSVVSSLLIDFFQLNWRTVIVSYVVPSAVLYFVLFLLWHLPACLIAFDGTIRLMSYQYHLHYTQASGYRGYYVHQPHNLFCQFEKCSWEGGILLVSHQNKRE